MREYGTIHKGFWQNEEFKGLHTDARLLAAYLLTSPHTAMTGAFRLPDAYACEDLNWTTERLRNGFETLSGIGFIKYSEGARWVWIVKFLQFNKLANPNMVKAAIKMAEAIPSAVDFRSEVLASLGVSETVVKPLRNTPSSSPSSSLSPIAEISILLADGSSYEIPEEMAASFLATYRRIDVAGEVRKAATWCVANPAQRKTARGAGKFLNSWLARAEADAIKNPLGGAAEWKASQPGGGRREL